MKFSSVIKVNNNSFSWQNSHALSQSWNVRNTLSLWNACPEWMFVLRNSCWSESAKKSCLYLAQAMWLTCALPLALVYSVVDEVWQQQTVLRLLQLIELPLLESLLEGREKPRPSLHGMDSDPDLLYTSNYVDREILKAFSESQYVETLCQRRFIIYLGCFHYKFLQFITFLGLNFTGCCFWCQNKARF